jgi:phosphonate transport system substrate-binding protein
MKTALTKLISALMFLCRRTIPRRLVALALVVASVFFLRGAGAAESTNLEPIRFAFSFHMFTDVNENDAKASVKAWALALAQERQVPMSTEPIILSGAAELKQALRAATIDGAAVTTEEFLSLEPELQGTNLFMSVVGGRFTEEYLLLVRADSGITDLRGLRGCKIILFENARASLAPLWLEVILSEKNLGAPADHFGQMHTAQKLVKVVLPVFFHQQDACIVTRRGFDTMCELNPQVRAQLRVVATSPELVPAVGFIRRGYVSPLRDTLMAALHGLETSANGTQVLTLFQTDRMQESSAILLNSARDLMATRQHLKLVAADVASPSRPDPDDHHESGIVKP